MNKLIFILLLFFSFTFSAMAEGSYQSREQFISEALHGELPKAKVLWLTADDKKVIGDIMNHRFNLLRVRYWQKQQDTVWILDEIGKEKPITIGVHINAQQIMQLKVLTFRESRGDEVRHDFFTEQFIAAKLTTENKLSQHIDGITGATMSVRALKKVARLALWLDKKAHQAH